MQEKRVKYDRIEGFNEFRISFQAQDENIPPPKSLENLSLGEFIENDGFHFGFEMLTSKEPLHHLLSNSSFTIKTKKRATNPLCNMLPLPWPFPEKDQEGEFHLIPKSELIRIIIQCLGTLGYTKSSALLELESGIPLYSPQIIDFSQYLLHGNYFKALTLVPFLCLERGCESNIVLIIYKELYYERIYRKDILGAIEIMKNNITPLQCVYQAELRELSSLLLLVGDRSSFLSHTGWGSPGVSSRQKLLHNIMAIASKSVIPPENRLLHLLGIALSSQKKCLYHNTKATALSLVEDHHCTVKKLPTATLCVLSGHSDEVWYIAFSHSGNFLASASRDGSVIIWTIPSGKIYRTLNSVPKQREAGWVAWSPDDSLMLTISNKNMINLWGTDTGGLLNSFELHKDAVTACFFSPDGASFFSGGLDKCIYWIDLEGHVLKKWETARINDLTVTPNSENLIAIGQDKRIHIISLQTDSSFQSEIIQETQSLTSLSVSKKGCYLLCNTSSHKIHLWDLRNRTKVRTFSGQRQSRFVIRSCFGGAFENFVCSGSEDSRVYIWHRKGKLLTKLIGHSGTVNSVCWNPTDEKMLASCSDDRTIRIWVNDPTKKKYSPYRNEIGVEEKFSKLF